ncbi:MAG: glycosyltransferase family 2 protein [Pirellula sp.]
MNWLLITGLLGFLLPSVVYPILIGMLSWLRNLVCGPRNLRNLSDDELPSVSFVLNAYNEQAILRQKLENTIRLDYPRDKMEVVVLSDASTDQTDSICMEFADRGVKLYRSHSRLGKSANITRFVPDAQGQIIVFSDANSIYQEDAIRRLVAHFSDPKVGYVVGAQRYLSESRHPTHDAENQYWELELKLKEWESNLSSVVGADGAIFAMRRDLFEPLAASDISDFLGPLKIVSRGYRGVFEPKAICYEAPVSSMNRNFSRKVRIITRSLQAVAKVPSVLLPWRSGWFSIQVLLHKLLRWFSPLFVILIFVGACIDAANGEIQGIMIMGLILAWIAIASLYLIPGLRRFSIVSAACYGLVVNLAALIGLFLAFSGKNINTWKPDR